MEDFIKNNPFLVSIIIMSLAIAPCLDFGQDAFAIALPIAMIILSLLYIMFKPKNPKLTKLFLQVLFSGLLLAQLIILFGELFVLYVITYYR